MGAIRTSEIEVLVALRDDGLLTEDEFQARRAKLLDES
jgi:hypothetical protein